MSGRTDAADLYRALLTSGRLTELRRLTYRCSTDSRCLLLDAVQTPLGTLLHQRRYKYSQAENLERSNASGRAANTYDGENHWRERTYFIESSALDLPDDSGASLAITCDHVLGWGLRASEFDKDWSARHAEVRVRPDGSRYTLR